MTKLKKNSILRKKLIENC